MRKYLRIVVLILTLEILLIVGANICMVHQKDAHFYRVEAKRVAMEIARSGDYRGIDLEDYDSIVNVRVFNPEDICNNDYVVEDVDGTLYRIEYEINNSKRLILILNGALFLMLLLSVLVLAYIGVHIIRPFGGMANMPYEIAKGNLTTPLKAQKRSYFGKMLWGMDMLRETLEDKRKKELELQKDKKTLILSLSHDIKTPLSAIKLYTKALQENLYDSKEKKDEALLGIQKNATEIENYVNQIVEASREDFLDLHVVEGEFYLSEAMQAIQAYYKEKLAHRHTDFVVEDFKECLIKGDKERVIEVLQNILENAIKYGDGTFVKLSFGEEEDCTLVSVANTGEGVTEAELVHLFDSFYRGSNARNVAGSGLGLYICRNLMRKMDGEVFAEQRDGEFVVTVVLRRA